MTPGMFDVRQMRRRLDDAQVKGLDVDYWRQALDAFEREAQDTDELLEIASDLETLVDDLLDPSAFKPTIAGALDDLEIPAELRDEITDKIDERIKTAHDELTKAVEERRGDLKEPLERLEKVLGRERAEIQGRGNG